jgi:HAD superfamily hydrolase (TIGR01509 family)
MAIEAVIFDMDGLLVDSEPTWDKARARMAGRVGKEWTQQDHINVMGVSTDEWGRYMIDRLELTASLEEVQNEIIREMIEMYRQEIPFKPFAVEAVKWAAAKYPTALASGSHPRLIEFVVQSPELQGCFDVIVAADEIGVGKPDPAIYLETAKRLAIAPEKCLCLEDSLYGVLAGRRAHMYVINIPDPNFPLPDEQRAAADLILNSLGELSEDVISRLESLR